MIRIIGYVLQHRAQIFQIEQQEAVLVRDLEDHVQHTGLGVIQLKQPAEQKRTHFGHGRAYGMAVLAEDIPKNDRKCLRFIIGDGEFLNPSEDLGIIPSGLAQARQIPFYIGHEHRHTARTEVFRQRLQRYCFTRTRGTRD